MSGLSEAKLLQIPFKEIELATSNFDKSKFIGRGGYGLVYRGELSISGKQTNVAVKRLNDEFDQGLKEFMTEIQLLGGQHHKNVISLLGYCNERKEKILVYEYAANGSLDTHLEKPKKSLPWRKRLEICLDAARGLNHLHTHARKGQTIIHRDIKSANILLDDDWVAKIADLGLSKLCSDGNATLDPTGRIMNSDPGNAIVSNPCGTEGYLDPEYMQGYLKKEYDVYSFGMVLFEVVCGRLCLKKYQDKFRLVGQTAKYYYKNNKMEEIIDPCLKEQMISSVHSINKFSELAHKCLSKDLGQRPSMHGVVKELEELLFFHDIESTSSKDVGNATDPVSILRYEKVKRILQRFDINKDGVLQREEVANFLVVTNPNNSQEQIQNNIDSLFLSYGEFANGEKVLTCDGMLRAYNYGVDYLNVHFEMLRLDFNSFDNNAVEFRTTERYKKVKRILQRYDINRDGCLNRQELASFLEFHNPNTGQQLVNNINNIFHIYEDFIDGDKGLTCDGLFRVYDYGIDNLHTDFESLHLDLKPFDENKAALRYEKVKRIFQRFDVNGDGGLNREELADLFGFTIPQYNYNEDKLFSIVDEVFTLFSDFVNGEKGLTCEGLFHNYDYGNDSVDADFETLRLDLKSLNDEEVALRTRERAEKVGIIFQRFDTNKDGGLNKEELAGFLFIKNGHNKSSEERTKDVEKLFRLYGEFIDGEKGLTCGGLLRTYDHGIDDLDDDFKSLGLKLKYFDKTEDDFLKERCEKVRKIFQRFDFNGDGGLNKQELASYLLSVDPHIKHTQETLNRTVDAMFLKLSNFIDDVTGLTYNGLIKSYEYGADDLDIHFNVLKLR